MLRLRLNPEAREDLREILRWSRRNFGKAAADRYTELLYQAFFDVQRDPELVGSRTHFELSTGARLYPVRLSRDRVEGSPVGAPRHILLYCVEDDILLIARILHDNNDIPKHFPAGLRR